MDGAIKAFKAQRIPVLEPGQPEYERAVATSNLLFRFSRPECVVQPETPLHVRSVVNEARTRGLAVTIKCNGHSYAGHSTAFQGISLDLRRMRKATLAKNLKTVTFDAGCQWGHVYETLINRRKNGFVIVGGRCPTVGVGGFLLGAGLSPFTRSFGMGSDTLVEATLVTASGILVTVNEKDDPRSDKGRLFWALRGAGGGNFGVVVSMTLKVQKLQGSDGTVVAGRYQWFPKAGLDDAAVVAAMNDFYIANWPNSMTIDSTWICDLRQPGALGGIRFTIVFDGTKAEYDRIIDQYITHRDLAVQLKRRALPEKSTRFLHETLVNQWLEETERAYPTNKTYELYSSFLFPNNDGAALRNVTATIRDLMRDFRSDFVGEQVNFLVTWIHSGGKATEMRPTDTAFFWREAVFHAYITVEWIDKWMERDMRGFLAKAKKALRPFSLNGEASFINFPDRNFPTKSHESAYFGGNRDELRRVKQIWDKDNFFKWIHGVRLPGDTEDEVDVDDDDDDTDGNGEGETDVLAGDQWEFYKTEDIVKDLDELADLGF